MTRFSSRKTTIRAVMRVGLVLRIVLVAGAVLAQTPPSPPVNLRILAGSGPPPSEPAYRTFYISPSGNDGNAGTEAAPFRTVERARTAVRTVNSAMAGNVIAYLREGTYTLANTVTFDERDSGNNGFQVIYAAYPGERPVLSGGQAITGWTPAGSGMYSAPVGALRFRQLYVNGSRAIRARSPNAGAYHQVRFWDIGGRRVEVASNEVGNWQRRNQVEMVILGKGVNQSNLRISSITVSGTGAVVTGLEPERTRLFQQGYPPKDPLRPYYFENALEFLDAPGEWYVNSDTDQVFYRPRSGEDMATAQIVAPRLERLVGIAGSLSAPVHHLQFRGLTFEHSTWLLPNTEGYIGDQASVVFTQTLPDDEISSYPGHRIPAGVHVESAHSIRFERNVLRRMGASALNFYRAVNDSVVVGNAILDVSGAGISVDLNLEGNPGDARIICRRNQLSNNYIAQTGRDYYQTTGIMLGYTDSTVVQHNELRDMPYSGITVGWGWDNVSSALRNNVVRYNSIQRVLNLMSDGGGIYTLSRHPGGLIAENYVHNIVRTSVQGGFNISGIYLDEGSDLITVRDNVLQSTGDRGIFQNGNGGGNTFSNNAGTSPSVIANAGLEPAYADIRPGSAQAAPAPPAGQSLVTAFAFNENAGTTAQDSSGAGGPASLVNGATWAAGRSGSAVNLDGLDDYMMVSGATLPTADFTYEAWIHLDRTNVFQTIIEALDGVGGPELEFDLAAGGRVEIWSNGAQRLTTSATIAAGVWTHVALTRAGGTLQVYINGVPAGPTGSDSGTLSFAGCPLLMGVDADAACTGSLNGFLDGRIDDVRIYNRALTQSEIQADMNTSSSS